MITAVKIDIEEEMKAIAEGQCGLCRLGATHVFTEACKLPFPAYKNMKLEECGHAYSTIDFAECPFCHE